MANAPAPPHLRLKIVCADCKGNGWGPMLCTEVWKKIEPVEQSPLEYERFLCEVHMRVRLGRELTSDDLRDCPMNYKHPLYRKHGRM